MTCYPTFIAVLVIASPQQVSVMHKSTIVVELPDIKAPHNNDIREKLNSFKSLVKNCKMPPTCPYNNR